MRRELRRRTEATGADPSDIDLASTGTGNRVDSETLNFYRRNHGRYQFSDEQLAEIRETALRAMRNASSDRMQILAIRALVLMHEEDRRRDKDDAERQDRRDNRLTSVIEQALATPEGRAALLARSRAAADALDGGGRPVLEDQGMGGGTTSAPFSAENCSEGEEEKMPRPRKPS